MGFPEDGEGVAMLEALLIRAVGDPLDRGGGLGGGKILVGQQRRVLDDGDAQPVRRTVLADGVMISWFHFAKAVLNWVAQVCVRVP